MRLKEEREKRLIREKRMFSVTHLIIRISEYMKNGFP